MREAMKRPTPHRFLEGGGVVTRCQDVRTARRLLVEEYLEDKFGVFLDDANRDSDWREYVAEASREFAAHKARVGHGRIVPAQPGNHEGASWYWHPGMGKPGQPGVTMAVWWDW